MQVEYSDRPLLAETANSDGERDDVDVPDDEEEDAPEDDVEVDVEGEGEADEGVEGAEGARECSQTPQLVRARGAYDERCYSISCDFLAKPAGSLAQAAFC